MSVDKTAIISWIQRAIGDAHFDVDIEGTTLKGEGYLAEMYFIRVDLKESNGDEKELYLAIKTGKDSPEFRQKFPKLKELYEREIIFYDKVIPLFKNFQRERRVKEPFDAVPKCYTTFVDRNIEVIIMEDLKKKGYELHPTDEPMNLQHARTALKAYAKFHALSFAMQDQKKEIFAQLAKIYYSHLKETTLSFKTWYEGNYFKLVDTLNEIGRQDLLKKYEKFVENGVSHRMISILDDIPDEQVVIHADCHNSNLLFKYKDAEKSDPTNVVLLDFQTSSLHSPMIDISALLYLGISKREFSEFEGLLDFYYTELSSFLIELGSDPNKLFPRSTMLDHWRRFSGYGFFIASLCIDLLFISKEDAPTMNLDEDGELLDNFLNLKLSNRDKYLERLVSILEHYFNYHNYL